ncbi:hypothetical protein F4825DRAFT_448060 [Nemania diffusa]|nr:hypothetical protein F4825DRAFT_448060 [Nemania diffusa]
MHRNVAIYGLLAYFTGLSAGADLPDSSLPPIDNLEVEFVGKDLVIPLLSNSTLTFNYSTDINVTGKFWLKIYNDDFSIVGVPLNTFNQHSSINIDWSHTPAGLRYVPLYLEFEWGNQSIAGNSTSPAFIIYRDTPEEASSTLASAIGSTTNTTPARAETSRPLIQTASTSITSTASTFHTQPTGQPIPTTEPQPSSPVSSSARGGLSRNSIIGIAVGVGAGGLLLSGVLLWLLCFRRRRSSARQVMPIYGSEVDVHAIAADKEMPPLDTPRPESTYGGSGRPSADYAPYSDRLVASPTSQQLLRPISTETATTTASDAAALASGTAHATSQTRSATTLMPPPMPSNAISRYAHLIEADMTEEQIRRLEEEERQLDAAIENAGRGRST